MMHQLAQVICKRVLISEDPQAKKRMGIAVREDNYRDVLGRLLLSTTHPTEWTGSAQNYCLSPVNGQS